MKYYAVKKGRKPGIYTDWATAEGQIKGFSGAEFKSFKSLEKAEKYYNKTKNETVSKNAYAYIDGSFNASTNVYGYGGFLCNNNSIYTVQGSSSDPQKATMRNVSGEIEGCVAIINKAIELKIPEIDIYYDYEGIEKWANDVWKAKNKWTQEYKSFMAKSKKQIKINFIKVAAHSGIEGNEKADMLAKQAVGIK